MSVLLSDVFEGERHVKKQDQSRVLQGHFKQKPIVPGVVLEHAVLVALALQGSHQRSTRTRFISPVAPGDTLHFIKDSERCYGITDELHRFTVEPGLSIEAFPPKIDMLNTADADVIIDAHLLQSDSFRFASSASIDSEGNITGSYRLPDDHALYEDSSFGRPILQESANQIISLAHSKKNNPDGVANGKTILLKESATHGHLKDVIAVSGSYIFLVGKILDTQEKRGVKAVYTIFSDIMQPLLSGEITGTEVPTKLLFR